MHPADSLITWSGLRDVDRAVLGGLVTERVGHCVAREPDRAMQDAAVMQGVREGVALAARGGTPRTPTTDLPRAVHRAVRWSVGADAGSTDAQYFPLVRVLELAGLVRLEIDDDYVLAMVSGLGVWCPGHLGPKPAPAQLHWVADDPGLVEHAVWRLFEVDGGGPVSLATIDRYGGGWADSFVSWCSDGTVERGRVVDACLRSLSADFSAHHAAWFRDLLAALDPSDLELAERQDALRHLLASDVPPTVGYAVRTLGRLQRAGVLDAVETAAVLAPAVTSGGKATALAAVRLLTQLARNPVVDVAPAAYDALSHPSADVQRAAARLLQERSPERLASAGDRLAPALAHELGLHDAAAPGPADDAPAAAYPGAAAEAARLDPVGIDLLERLAAVLEDPADPLELELVLDGLAASGDAAHLRPLRRRAEALLRRGVGDWGPRDALGLHLAALVVRATGGHAKVWLREDICLQFLGRRLQHVEAVLTGRAPPGPLVATPDHTSGLVSPERLVRRAAARAEHLETPDLVAGLLRLDPDGRDAGLRALTTADLPDELRDVLVHAFGGNVVGPHVDTAAWWVAAARARAPLDDDPLVIAAGLGGAGLGHALRTRLLAFGTRSTGMEWQVAVDRAARLRRPVSGSPEAASAFTPTAVAEQPRRRTFDADPCGRWARWVALVFPHDAEHAMVTGVLTLAGGVEPWASAAGYPHVRDVLSSLARHPGRLGPLVHAGIAFGLTQSSAENRLVAVDLAADLAQQGRLDVGLLVEAMATIAEAVTPTRWAEALGRVADAGRPEAVVDVLTGLLPRLDRSVRGLHALLDVLLQESARSGRRVTDATLREWLSGFGGSSVSARRARDLLAL